MMELLIRDEKQVTDILEKMFQFRDGYVLEYGSCPKDVLIKDFVKILDNLKNPAMNQCDISMEFINLGSMVIKLMDIEGTILDESTFAKFLLNKHQKYGTEPLISCGSIGIIFRIISKIGRFINMQQSENLATGPDEEDTLMDILGYSILGFQLERRIHV